MRKAKVIWCWPVLRQALRTQVSPAVQRPGMVQAAVGLVRRPRPSRNPSPNRALRHTTCVHKSNSS